MALPSKRPWRPWVFGLGLIGSILIGLAAWAGLFDTDPVATIAPQRAGLPRYRNTALIYLSGDVGLNIGLGQNLVRRLADDGFPVVTINSLAFFRRHRGIPEVAALIRSAVAQARAARPGARVLLVGHSLGADALQASLATFTADERKGLGGAILIVPTREVYLGISPAEMLDLGTPDATALPSLRTLTWLPLGCIYGRDETRSPCPVLASRNVWTEALPGGHWLDGDVNSVHAAVLRGIDRALAPANHAGFR